VRWGGFSYFSFLFSFVGRGGGGVGGTGGDRVGPGVDTLSHGTSRRPDCSPSRRPKTTGSSAIRRCGDRCREALVHELDGSMTSGRRACSTRSGSRMLPGMRRIETAAALAMGTPSDCTVGGGRLSQRLAFVTYQGRYHRSGSAGGLVAAYDKRGPASGAARADPAGGSRWRRAGWKQGRGTRRAGAAVGPDGYGGTHAPSSEAGEHRRTAVRCRTSATSACRYDEVYPR